RGQKPQTRHRFVTQNAIYQPNCQRSFSLPEESDLLPAEVFPSTGRTQCITGRQGLSNGGDENLTTKSRNEL
ncbi:hypothetical protein, partial [Bremerella cremea]|uniref:hypothetical protein n=1 Tax=Bremerella cremea TaxID=1031537 RepID=UPI0031ED2D61